LFLIHNFIALLEVEEAVALLLLPNPSLQFEPVVGKKLTSR